MSNFLTGLNQLDPSVKRHNGGGSSFTLDESGTTNATRLVVGGVEQVPGVDFTVSGTTLSTTSATPSGTNNVVSFQYFKSGTVNTATAVATGGVNNAAMADDAIGIAELSATGTASSSTFLRGDNAWAAPAAGTKEVFFNPSQGGTGTHQSANVGEFNGWDVDSAGDDYRQNFFCPNDFSSLSELVIVAIADATESMSVDLTSEYAAHGQAHTTHTETSNNVTTSFTDNEIEEIDVSGVFSSLAANDYCGLTVKGDVNTLHIIGIRMKYA